MSAVRRNDRRAIRNNLSSPYARPSKSSKVHPSKKSLWSLSGLISFLNPFGGNNEPDDSDMSGPSDGEIEQGPPPRRFSPPQPLPPPPPPPEHQLSPNSPRPLATNGLTASSGHVPQPFPNRPFSLNTPSPTAFSSSASLAKNLEPVTRFLVEKAGQPLNEFEAAGIVDYIQKSVQGPSLVSDKPEPFRFSVSPSRGPSPNHGQGASSIETPRKTLSRNPNGVYRWQGAGSSRPRNRYQSPGFAPRPQQHRIRLSPPKTPLPTDTKRRRVGDEAEFSTPQKPAVPSTSTINFPSSVPESPIPPSRHTVGPSGTAVNGKTIFSSPLASPQPVTPKANVPPPRLRTGGLKPTTPAIPSPLRQTWKESDSPPHASPPSRPTRAADFMTELIKEVTPTKRPDVSNPYQTASPVKPPAPVRKPTIKRPRPTAKPAEKPKEEQEISAQAIIEATVPKGTKRSRPPPEVEKLTRAEEVPNSAASSALNGPSHAMRSTFNIAETSAILDSEESPSKRRKTPLTQSVAPTQEIDDGGPFDSIVRPAEIIEPVDDIAHLNSKPPPAAAAATLSPPSVTKSVFSGLKTSAPKEPSKLRYSFHADKVEVKNPDAVAVPPLFAPLLVSSTIPETTAAPTKAKLSPKKEALAMSIDELPKYTFSVGTVLSSPAGPSLTTARNSVLTLAATSLPVYDFPPSITSVRAMNGFNWTAAGMKAPIASAQTWTCSTCSLQNPADAKEKCTICDAPRQAPTNTSPSVPVLAPTSATPAVTAPRPTASKSFDWSAAGLTPPPKLGKGTWICSVCSLSNPTSAEEKCTICDAPREVPTNTSPSSPMHAPASVTPVITSPRPTASKSFDWSAAGLTPPPKPEKGTWMCSVCSLSNPASAADKCSVCDAPR